ncbi:MAG: hypothetical protein PF689_00110 [Deltaproteobacteria bacterium]|jgi:hypothetical protein|nr:hypothetical protein [Deltaproteobacteria bacterium]
MFNLSPALVWGQSNSSNFSWSGRWEHTDIDWFWFYSPLPSPPQTDNLLHCSTTNYSTFSWHYYGQSDPALADPNFPPLIKDYINWEARAQPIGGPCWAHADSLVLDIKYKIYHDLYDQRTLNGPCNLTENLESPGQNCNFNNPLPHFSEESILSARTYYTDYSEADNDLPHLDPYYFGRALSALGGGNIFLSPHINEICIYPRRSATYNYNNEFSPFSIQFYPKVGLPDHNLRKFEFATALVPHLAGNNKFNYFWDENQGTWKETELIMEVTP